MKVLMIGPDRSVHGGISGVVNNWYEAGLKEKVDIDYIGTMQEGSKLKKLLVAIVAYVSFSIKLSKYDLVHVNMASDSSYIRKSFFVNKAYRKQKKIVIHQHGGNIDNYYDSLNKEKKKRMELVFQKADLIIALSLKLKEFFEKFVDDVRIEILPNSVMIPNEKCLLNKDYSKKNIIFLGRICKDKGINELIEAVECLKNEYPDLILSLGGIFEDEELENKILERNDYIHYLGWIVGKEKEKALGENSILVLPSYYEGMPVCILDAMAYGLCVVSTDVGGVSEVIENQYNGVLIAPKNVEELTTSLEQLLANEPLVKELAVNGRKTVEESFSSQRAIDRLINIYEHVVKG